MDLKSMYRDQALRNGYTDQFVSRVMKETDIILLREDVRRTYFSPMIYALKTAHDKVVEEWRGMILEGIILD